MKHQDTSNKNPKSTILITAAIAFFLWAVVFIYRTSFIAVDGNRYFCLFDDAMISMRYAWNLVQGHGLVWNVGERVEGYTNLLMTLLMSVPVGMLSKSNSCLFIQVCGAGCMLLIAYGISKIADFVAQDLNPKDRSLVKVLSFIAALSYYPLAYFSLMGVETGLLTLCLVYAVLSLLEFTKQGQLSYVKKSSLAFACAFLTRTDSVIFFFMALLYFIWHLRKTKGPWKNYWKQVLFFVGLYSCVVIAQLMFRYIYYGEFSPNTYILKVSGLPLLIRLNDGWIYSVPFLLMISPILVIILWSFLKQIRIEGLFLFSFFVAALGYQMYVGGDPWDYWRFTSPAMPFLFILFIIAVIHWVRSSAVWNRLLKTASTSPPLPVIIITIAGLLLANIDHIKEQFLLIDPYQRETNEMNVNIAIVITQFTFTQASVGVLYAGAIPFYSERKAIDFLGKSDKYIARLAPDISGKSGWNGRTSIPGHNKYDLNYSIKILQPEYVQSFVLGDQNLRDYRDSKYIDINYRKVHVLLRDDSPYVDWEKISRSFRIKRWDVGVRK